MFGYSSNYLIDSEDAAILDVEATPTPISKEVDDTETMIDRTEQRFALKPNRLAGDTGYGTGGMPDWLVARKTDPHIPVWDKGERKDGRLPCEEFLSSVKGSPACTSIHSAFNRAAASIYPQKWASQASRR